MLKFMSYLFYSYFPTCDITYHDIVNHINVEWLSLQMAADRALQILLQLPHYSVLALHALIDNYHKRKFSKILKVCSRMK